MSRDLLVDVEKEWFGQNIPQLAGPIVVFGASGFVGSLLSSVLRSIRHDVTLVSRSTNSWRLVALDLVDSVSLDLARFDDVLEFLNKTQPRTIFNLAASGAYPSQKDSRLMTQINIELLDKVSSWCLENRSTLVHAGSSSEYGRNCDRPIENSAPIPNSFYGITKYAGTCLLQERYESSGLVGAVLRLYSIFGPLEDPKRLFPTLIRCGLEERLPQFSPPQIGRDFVYISDAIRAFVMAALWAQRTRSFGVFNIGSGSMTTMAQIAEIARNTFQISEEPEFVERLRSWDLERWCADASHAQETLIWETQVRPEDGLLRMLEWYKSEKTSRYLEDRYSVQVSDSELRTKISAIVACYRDETAIPIMYERLKAVFEDLKVSYEIIFVNDGSPDDTTNAISRLSRDDSGVLGIVHSRNFGSQAAFMSGLRISRGDCCVLLDGDLQDPPEVISQMFPHYLKGFDVVYGKRISREASRPMNLAYRTFYRIFKFMSPFEIPVDAGDFSLMSRTVVNDLLAFGERDVFLRTNRAYIGRDQIGVEYHRPERLFGKSTNNFFRNIQWAIKGVVSASRKPLSILSTLGVLLVGVTTSGLLAQVLFALFFPSASPAGIVTVVLLVGFFGALNLLGVSILGEYVGRILEEVRGRPRYIQSSVIRDGRVHESPFRDQ